MTGATAEFLSLVAGRMRRHEALTLAQVAGRDTVLAHPDDAVVDHLLRNRARLLPWLASARAAAPLATWAGRWLRSRNQFIDIDMETLRAGYRRGLTAAAGVLRDTGSRHDLSAGLRPVLDAHASWLSRLLRDHLGEAPVEVVSGRYSPALQLVALASPRLSEPVLDVGCGNGALVRSLRRRGVDATGLDRDPPVGAGLVAADWLTFDYGVERWGTVLSHLGLSLHFLHHELRRGPACSRYARAYLRILASLRPGGRFVYVPSLPFIEAALDPGEFEVSTHRVPFAAARVAHVRRRPSGSPPS